MKILSNLLSLFLIPVILVVFTGTVLAFSVTNPNDVLDEYCSDTRAQQKVDEIEAYSAAGRDYDALVAETALINDFNQQSDLCTLDELQSIGTIMYCQDSPGTVLDLSTFVCEAEDTINVHYGYSCNVDGNIWWHDSLGVYTEQLGTCECGCSALGCNSCTDEITNPFSDLSDSHKNIDAILYLYDEGVIAGYPNGTFRASQTVNRAELLKILVEGQGVTPDESVYANCFPDVNEEWFAKYVCYAKEQGWVDGYPDGSFKPANTVNKVESLKMLLKSQGQAIVITFDTLFDDVPEDQWFARYVFTAESLGLLEEHGGSYHPDGDMMRAGISENLYRLLIK